MKRILLLMPFAAILLAYVSATAQQAPPFKTIKTTADRQPNNAVTANMNDDWYAQAISGIQQLEYGFYKKEANTFTAANTKNRVGFHIQPNGYSVQNVKYSENDGVWTENFTLAGIGRNKLNSINTSHYATTNDNASIIYHFPSIDVQYINNESGLRQNFIVKNKISGNGDLRIVINLSGDLHAKVTQSGKVNLFDSNKAGRLTYEDLKVWDANHKPLASEMKFDEKNKQIILAVNDKNATYPIVIDPLNKTPEWSTSVDGVLSTVLTDAQLKTALYGYAVAGLGDVNGDGFGDAAITAPGLVDVFSGSGTLASVGAVFVFYGTSHGLSTTPGKTLQPTTAVAGALFGLSIDAGDVTGDGINDIIVGAPLDKVDVNAGILGTLHGTVGKVYIYPGGSFVQKNPTNFLTIQLDNTRLTALNISVNALFGFSVAVTEDLNHDGRQDIIVGSPAFASASILLVKTGGAFVFTSNTATNKFTAFQSLTVPTFSVLGISIPLISSINGLLFGYSVDGHGDYNGDGKPDVVVGAPAGINLSSLTGILTGQVLGGQAFVYYGNGGGVSTGIGAKLQAASTGLLSNAANLFGYKVKGVRGISGARNGNIVIGAPLGGLLTGVLHLSIQSGNIHVFKAKLSSPAGVVTSDQVIETPKSSGLLSILSTMQLNVLFGAGIDNAYDINCDGYPDLVVGEPLSSGTNLLQLQANAVGGAAYVFIGDGTGGYVPTSFYDVQSTYGPDNLSINATALFGFNVAGVPHVKGFISAPRILVGAPSGALDFSSSLLNLGSTLGTLFSFAVGNNGLGKGYLFHLGICSEPVTLPVTMVSFAGQKIDKTVQLKWTTTNEVELSHYEVEKSIDGVNYATNAIVFAAGNSHNDYTIVDKTPSAVNYYRLKIVDNDLKFKYSTIIEISFLEGANATMTIAPNPASSSFNVKLAGLETGSYRLELRNMIGQLQASRSINVSSTQHTEVISRTSAMVKGMYTISVYNKDNILIKTMQVFAD